MDWLKDKKNLPIVASMAVVVLLAMIGLIAFELGAFSGSGSAAVESRAASVPAAGGPGGAYPGGAGSYPGGAYPGAAGGYPGGSPGGASVAPVRAAALAASAAGAKTSAINPLVGADPFALPNGRKPLTGAAALRVADALRPRLRDSLPPMTLFTLRPPRPEASSNFSLPSGAEQLLANTRVSGIVNAADGIFAVVEINGTSQTVKPGDALPDGSKVASIQSTGVTLHTPGGNAITVPLSNGPPQSNQPTPYGGGYGGYPGGGYPGGYPGGGFGGYPGGGFGGYPGGFGGGGYPGGGYPGGGGGGYPGGGFGGGGYPGGDPGGGQPE